MLLPYVEQDAYHRRQTAATTPGGQDPRTDASRMVPLKLFLDPGRGRPGVATAGGNLNNTTPAAGGGGGAGPMTDYAINVNVNAGSATTLVGCCGGGGTSVAGNRRTIPGIPDGSSNTILAGTKYVPIGRYGANDTNWDEGILAGSWGGPGRSGTGNPTGSTTAPGYTTGRPGQPGYLPDGTVGTGDYWGGPFPGGGLFLFGDGAVRGVPYDVDKVTLFRLLAPSDGQPVNLP